MKPILRCLSQIFTWQWNTQVLWDVLPSASNNGKSPLRGFTLEQHERWCSHPAAWPWSSMTHQGHVVSSHRGGNYCILSVLPNLVLGKGMLCSNETWSDEVKRRLWLWQCLSQNTTDKPKQTKPNKKLDGKVWQRKELTRIQMAKKAISGYWSAQHLCHPFKGGNPFLNSGSGMPWSPGSEKQQSSSWQLLGCIPPSQRSGLSSPASSHLSFFSHLHLPASWQPPAQRKKNKQKCLLIKDH